MDPFETGAMAGMAVGILVVYLIILFLALAYSVVAYVLGSLGAYQIAKRRGIHNPWLAWIPVGNSWLLGSISDHFQYVSKGKTTKRRILLLSLNIAMCVIMVVFYVFYFVMMTGMMVMAPEMNPGEFLGFFGVLLVIWLVIMAVSLTYSVFAYMSYFDLFKSCKPDNAVLFLVLSIFVNVTLPFFIFACRKADEGMPPKIRSNV